MNSIATAKSTAEVTWIFTDEQSSNLLGSSAAKDYREAAQRPGSAFVSVVLQCSLDENLKRITAEGRGAGLNTKLTDLSILRRIRDQEDIFHFGDELELELDITHMSPCDAARSIYKHIGGL